MKKAIIIGALFAMGMSSMSLADDIILADNEIYKIVLHDIEATEDYSGKPAVALDMTATVKNEPTNPMVIMAYDLTVYQNNKSMDTAVQGKNSAFYDVANNIVTDIKDGASVEFSAYYLLENTSSDVEIEYSQYGVRNDDTVILYYSPTTDEITTDAPTAKPEPDYKAMYEELKTEYDELLEKYNELINE